MPYFQNDDANSTFKYRTHFNINTMFKNFKDRVIPEELVLFVVHNSKQNKILNTNNLILVLESFDKITVKKNTLLQLLDDNNDLSNKDLYTNALYLSMLKFENFKSFLNNKNISNCNMGELLVVRKK